MGTSGINPIRTIRIRFTHLQLKQTARFYGFLILKIVYFLIVWLCSAELGTGLSNSSAVPVLA